MVTKLTHGIYIVTYNPTEIGSGGCPKFLEFLSLSFLVVIFNDINILFTFWKNTNMCISAENKAGGSNFFFNCSS